jgi:CheY-like chemotaxis protein
LVVDDDRDAIDTFALWLRHRGHVVLTAGGGLAAVEIAGGFRPDLVLLDLTMHGMDGWEVARRLRQDPASREAYIVYVTADPPMRTASSPLMPAATSTGSSRFFPTNWSCFCSHYNGGSDRMECLQPADSRILYGEKLPHKRPRCAGDA